MTYSFNLVDRKWIPCIQLDGSVYEFSLRETLTHAHELRGIQGDSPLETAALYRFLLAVLHSTLRGPRNRSEWADLWNRKHWDMRVLDAYLDKWRQRFDLFDPIKPFFQAVDKRVRPKSVISLVIDMASGNNAVLFDHHTEAEGESLSTARAGRALLVAQCFSLAGLSGLDQKFTDGPWGRGIIFLVEGDNLFETLVLNLLRYPDSDGNNPNSEMNDQPAWELDDPYHPERQIPKGNLDYLTWQNRRITLIPAGDETSPIVRWMTMAPGLRLDSTILDPMKLYRTGKEEGYISRRFSENRALWRDSAALFSLQDKKGNRPPMTFYWLADLVSSGFIPQAKSFRFMALGMANDQAKVESFHEEHLPLPIAYLRIDELVEQLTVALDLAEQIGYSLKIACRWLAILIISPKSDGKKWPEIDRMSKIQAENLVSHWNIERYYWQQLDVLFQRFLEDLPANSEAIQKWNDSIRKAAWQSLEQAASFAGIEAQALKAAVRARSSLGRSLKELYPESEKEATL